tara:strand:+ start:1672 stop:2172 length:501 start_codon:yes stop_codon:yes gene_type:complete
MKSYPVWNKVTACIYKSDKSYGIKETGEVEVLVGTSASNSHHFLNHKTTHRVHENGDREYRFYVNDCLIQSATLKKGASKLRIDDIAVKEYRGMTNGAKEALQSFLGLPSSDALINEKLSNKDALIKAAIKVMGASTLKSLEDALTDKTSQEFEEVFLREVRNGTW